MNCIITWDGECSVNERWHACIRDSEYHPGRHHCACGARTTKFLNPPPPPPPRAPRIYQRKAPRTRPWNRRDPTYYYPKYLKRKRGIT